MGARNKTLHISYRYLAAGEFAALYQTFLEAYADYFFPVHLTEKQLENHIAQNSVELARSVGAFHEDKMVGFTLNGFGVWNEKKTVYDAGTGIVPAFRNRGIGKALFDFMTPRFQREGFEQILLEVISHNERAIGLYRSLGFETARRLVFFERKTAFEFNGRNGFEIREITAPDWKMFGSFADGKTSWQNAPEAIRRTLTKKLVLGAFYENQCIGYGIVTRQLGMIAQLAVAPEFRRRGAASSILAAMQTRLGKEKSLRAGNVSENNASAVGFLKNRGFHENFSQFEMIKKL